MLRIVQSVLKILIWKTNVDCSVASIYSILSVLIIGFTSIIIVQIVKRILTQVQLSGSMKIYS